MYNLPYTNKQINIPYLLKIGNGKICKIGKYLKDKNLPGVALFLGDGTEELVGAELRRGFGDNGINVVHGQVVSDISIESITQTAFQLPPALWECADRFTSFSSIWDMLFLIQP